MSMDRIDWPDLPTAVRAAVEARTGPVQRGVTAAAGLNSGIATTLHGAEGTYFVKGVPLDHPQVRTQQRESGINPYLPPSCPRILWHVRAAGWDLIGYEPVDGRHADYTPGSPDLPLVAAALAELQQTPCPRIPLKGAGERWAGYLDRPEDAELLSGTTLLHTDLAPHNVLITDRAHIIDWAWPTRGAAWLDPAILLLHLMEAGHSAEDADRWMQQVPSWSGAPHEGLAAFAQANARLWGEIARESSASWKGNMSRCARTWSGYLCGRR